MKNVKMLMVIVSVFGLTFCVPKDAKMSTEANRMQWWSDARFGMFIHWGVNSVSAGICDGKAIPCIGERILSSAKIMVDEYTELNPVKYDPEAWVQMAKRAIVSTTKHHDGFALSDSKITGWDIIEATPRGEYLLKPLVEASGRVGMKTGVNYSQAQDNGHPGGAMSRKLMGVGWTNPDSTKIDQDSAAQPDSGAHAVGKQFDLAKEGSQTIQLGRFPFEPRKAGRISCQVTQDQGELNGTLVLRMLGRDGTDLGVQSRLLGGFDLTREVELNGLRSGAALQVAADFISAEGTAMVGVELKAEVRKAPCSLQISGLALQERKGGESAEDAGGRLLTTPEAGFAYGRNLLPAMDSQEWVSAGAGAEHSKGPAGQAVLALREQEDGTWKSPPSCLKKGTKELCLQGFVKFDAQATPYESPFIVEFQNSKGKALPPAGQARWPFGDWVNSHGEWFPVAMRFPVPDQATAARLVVKLGKGRAADGHLKGKVERNNFVVFQMAGLRLWESDQVSPAGRRPFNYTALAGGVVTPGPFVPCSAQQANTISLWASVNDTNNLYFAEDGCWPSPKAWVENYLPVARTVELKGEVFDWAGTSLGNVSSGVTLNPYEARIIELPIAPIKFSGCYSINLEAVQDGAVVGKGVIRWACLRRPNDRADRRSPLYPFCFHPRLSGQGAFSQDADEARYTEQELRTLRAMGVRGFRLQCRLWALDGTDTAKAIAHVRNYSQRFHDQVWPGMQKYGFEGYITFFPKPFGKVPENGTPEMAAWKEYVAAAVKAYPEISVFAFGNEEVGRRNQTLDDKPAVWGYQGSMRDYTREFLAAREAALAARPEVTFLVGQATDPDANVVKLFFEAGGTAAEVQGWAINTYIRHALTWKNISDGLRRNNVDLSKCIGLIPEIGYGAPTRADRFNVEKKEAINLVVNQIEILATAPWVRDINWFTTIKSGLLVNNYVYDMDWSPKPMAAAYHTISSTLGAGRPVQVPSKSDANLYVWDRPDGTKAGIIWQSKSHPAKTQPLRLRVCQTSGTVTVRDLMGNDTMVPAREGVVSVEACDSPIYLLDIETLTEE